MTTMTMEYYDGEKLRFIDKVMSSMNSDKIYLASWNIENGLTNIYLISI